MELFPAEILEKLLANGQATIDANGADLDHKPVVKLFTPDAGATWLLSEILPHDPDTAFGLCDLGMGVPELGYVSISELKAVRGGFGLPIERDIHFEADKTLAEYNQIARRLGRIDTDAEQ